MRHDKTILRDSNSMMGSVTCSCGEWCRTFTMSYDTRVEESALDHIDHEHRNHIVKATNRENLQESWRNYRPQLQVMEPTPTLRDQFAMAVMTGVFSSGNLDTDQSDKTIAELCYKMADVMLEARQ